MNFGSPRDLIPAVPAERQDAGPFEPTDFKWTVATADARQVLGGIRKQFGDRVYDGSKRGLQRLVTGYINTGDMTKELGDSISPIGGGDGGEQRFKVRWALPGGGKSGGLRLGINLQTKLVRIVYVAYRRDNPTNEQISNAFDES